MLHSLSSETMQITGQGALVASIGSVPHLMNGDLRGAPSDYYCSVNDGLGKLQVGVDVGKCRGEAK
jgi:hypothetical protein